MILVLVERSGAAMTHPLIRNVLMLLAGGALGAYAGSAAAEGLRPNFPIRLPEAAAPAVADAPVATAPAAPAPAKPALRLTPIGVESRPLAPVAQRAAPATLRRSPSDFQVDEWPSEPEAGLIKVANRRKAPSHKSAAAEESDAPATYTVRKGDTLDKIAGKLGTSVAELKKINGLKRSTIHPGQKLKGPAPAGGAKASAHKETGHRETGKTEAGRKAAARPETYTVKKGDTLFSIARRHGVSVEELRAANGLKAKGAIRAGQKLKLGRAEEEAPAEEAPPRHGKAAARPERVEEPSAVEETTAGGRTITTRSVTGRVVEVPGGASSYKVKKGDTIGEVADKLGVSVATLKKTNRLKSNTIRRGQVLKGPKTTAHAYVAGSGDTIVGVAKRFGVTPEALRAANGLKRSVLVARPGQKLRLPSGYHDRGAVTVTTRVPAPAAEAPPAYTPPPRREEPAPALPSRPQPYSGGSRYTPPVAPAPAAPSVSDAQVSQLGRGRFVWPLQGEIISAFGAKPGGARNDGINIRASTGDPVRVAASGDVVYAGDQVPGFGNLVLVKHPDGWVTAYGHLSRVDVKMQQKVTQGQQIGLAGATGGVAEPQLHFEIRYGAAGERARPIDPNLVLPR
jgi:murein DD-endopeptidase MepM/ murein hydrolase activator NlpD